MPQTIDIEAIRKLSVEQRLKLMEMIWDSLADEEVPFSDATLREMMRRSDWAKTNPDKLVSHEEMTAASGAWRSDAGALPARVLARCSRCR